MKVLFDINKSLKLCPPNYGPGVKFKKRIILNRSDVTYPAKHQIRVLNIDEKKVPEIRDSFLVKGYVHTEYPPSVKVDPNNKERFIGLSGYHRNAAANQAGWETMMYDVLEFDSPLTERIHSNNTNKDRLPFVPTTRDDIVKQIKEAVANKEIPNEDADVKKLISIIASDKTEDVQDLIFRKFRRHISYSATLLCYRAQGSGEGSTKEYAEKYNLPYSGDRFYNKTKRLGYITSESTPKTAIIETYRHFREYGQKVEFYAFIENPIESQLKKQRKDWKRKFDNFIEEECLSIQFFMKKMGFNVSLNAIKQYHPVVFVGFLHQDISPNEFDSGKPLEDGVVDEDGNRVDVEKMVTEKVTKFINGKMPNKFLGIDEEMPSNLLDLLNT